MAKHIFTEEESQNIYKGFYEEKLSIKDISLKYHIGMKPLRRFIKEHDMKRENINKDFYKDETGNKYGRLTVLKDLHKVDSDKRHLFLCQCECGNVVEVSGKRLRSGNTRSCGCLQKEKALNTLKYHTKLGYTIGQDLTGKVFGELTVLEEVEPLIKSTGKTVRQWKCQCSCGNIVVVQHVYLTTGDTQSCGCINSQGAAQIKKILNDNNISYIREYSTKELKTKNASLCFDYAIINDKKEVQYFIEFDGTQHYDKNNGYYFKRQIFNDLRKNKYCLEKHIPLIRIPYKEKDKMTFSLLIPSSTKKEYLVTEIDHYHLNEEMEEQDEELFR